MAETRDLTATLEDGLLSLTLNRPQRMNALSLAMVEDAVEAIAGAQENDAVRAIALRGAGRAFCAGGDVKAMADREGWSEAEHAAYFRRVHRLTYSLFTSRKPTLAVVNGACFGAGLSLALACDMRIAWPQARFGAAFLDVGLAGDHGISWLLSRHLGAGRAKEWMLRATRFDAETALREGIVGRVLPAHDTEAALRAEVAALTGRSGMAVRLLKENFDAPVAEDFRAALDREASSQAKAMTTPEFRAARDALLKK